MKQILKRTISLLLCVALLLGYVPAVVFAAETKTVYYYNAASNWSSVSVYYWGSANDPGWPGNAMTNLGNGYWSAEVPTGITGIIFNNGNNGKQTRDLSLPTDSKNCYAGGSWIVYTGDAVEIKKATVYVDATACGWTNVNAYYWGGSDSCMWPGTPMTLVADGVYAIEISEDTIYIIFNNGTDHTNDLTFPGDGYIYNGNDWSLYEECAHEYESVVTAPTCAVDGYTTHTCSKCGDSYTDSKVAALGHSYTEGVCMVCGYVGEIVINITDSYGDGWNGNAIEVYENDNLVLTATMTNGKNASVSVPCINGRAYTFKWVKGSYAGECSFEIKVNDETAFSATTNDCGEYANSEQLYKLCNHSYGEGVQTEPTCTEKGGLVYTCSVCGNKRIEGEIPALGHSYVEGVCTVCGAEDITIYVQPNSNWLSGNARFAAYFFGNGEMWVDCVDTGNGLYAVEVPEGFTYVIFCRMDPSTTDNSWIKKWNQTKDLEVPTDDKVVYVVDGWDNGAGQWIEFGGEPVEPEVVYYLRGSMNGWGDGNPMTKNADGTWTVTIALEAGEYEYKAVVADWATSYPSGVNAVVTVEKACDVTFVLDIAKGEITAECEKVECEHEYESVVTAPTCAVDGYTTHTCSKCGDSYTDSKVAATGHSVSGDACVNCGKAASEIIVDSGTCGDNLTWTLSAVGTLTISGTGDMDGFDYGSTPWYNYSEVITNVLVENGVTSIGDYAFSECSYLAYVSLPVGLTYIGENAFSNTRLTYIDLPWGLNSIGNYAFYCTGISSLVFPETLSGIGEGAFANCPLQDTLTLPEGLNYLGEGAFAYCPYLYGVNLPSSLTVVGGYAFSGCGNLSFVSIPEGVQYIDNGAFMDCFGLISVTFPETLDYVGCYAFSNCNALTSVEIPVGMTSIGDNAFSGCTALTEVYIGTMELAEPEEPEVTLPEDPIALDPWGGILSTLAETESVAPFLSIIGSGAFYGCTALVDVYYGGTKSQWEQIEIRNGNECLTDASVHCTDGDICKHTYESVVTEPTCDVEGYTTHTCSKCGDSYTDSETPATGHSVSGDACVNCNTPAAEIVVDSGTWGGNVNWVLTADYTLTISGSGDMADCGWQNAMPWLEYNQQILDVIIEPGITSIGNEAFRYCWELRSISIPDSVTRIGNFVFESCVKLTSVTIPGSVTTIGNSAFLWCDGLTTVYIGIEESTEPEQPWPGFGPNVTEPSGPWVRLTADSGPNLTTIGNRAFYGCTVLTDVYYGGTKMQWEQITIADGNECLTDADIHCTDGDVCHHTCEGVVTAPTCTDQGYTTYTCSKCGYAYMGDYVEKLAHDYTGVVTEPTCSAQGFTVFTCKVCGYSYVGDRVNAKGHSYGDWVTLAEPTCSSQGHDRRICSVCKAENNRYTPTLDHSYNTTVVAPTCAAKGYTLHTCSVCGATTKDSYVDKLPHSFSNWAVDKKATVLEEGIQRRICGACGHVESQTVPRVEVDVHTNPGYGLVSFEVVNAQTLKPISNAQIFVSTENEGENTFVTDAEGEVSFVLPVGKQNISAYAPNCLVRNLKITVNPGVNASQQIGLSDMPTYDAEITSKEMTLEEIKAAGIDTSDPSNQHMYRYELKLEFEAEVDWESIIFYFNADGKYRGGHSGPSPVLPDEEKDPSYTLHYHVTTEGFWHSWCEYEEVELGEHVSLTYTPWRDNEDYVFDGWYEDSSFTTKIYSVDISEYNTTVYGRWIYVGEPEDEPPAKPKPVRVPVKDDVITVYPVSEYFYLIVRGEVTWLKEMFDVEMLVINNSKTDTLEDLTATLELPEGLSLATMTGEQQSLSQYIDHIAEGESESVHWYVRGDAAGSYGLQARLQGTVMPFEEPIDQVFVAEDQLHVWAGDAMHLHFDFPNAAFHAEDYPITVTLTNVSDITLYNVHHMIQLEQGMRVYYSDDTKKERITTSEWASIGVREFHPGDKIIIEMSVNIFFESDIIKHELEKLIGIVDGIEQLINAIDAIQSMLDAAEALENCVNGCLKALDDFDFSAGGDKEELALFEVLYGKISGFASSYITSGNMTIDAAAGVANSTLNAALNAIAADPEEWLAENSLKDIQAVISSIAGMENALLENSGSSKKFDLFDSIRTAISAIPIRFVLKSVFMTEDENNTTSIPWSYSVSDVGPHYFGVSSVSKYLMSLVQAGLGEVYDEVMPWYLQLIPGLDDPIGKEEAIKYIQATEDEIARFKAKDATGQVTFRVWVERNDMRGGSAVVATANDFLLSTNNETAVYENGVLTFTGDGMIDVIPQNQTGGTLYIEDSEGNLYTYVIDVVEAHECVAGDREMIVVPTVDCDGFSVKTCQICGEIMEVIPVSRKSLCAEHTIESWTTEVESEGKEAGVQSGICTVCGFVEYRYVDVYVSDARICIYCGDECESVTVAPTCTDEGYDRHTCVACGKSYTDNETEAAGHGYESVVTAPTCTEKGYTTHTCSACGYSYVDGETDVVPHSYESVVTAPTCTEKGYTTHTCSDCGYNYVDGETDVVPHSYDSVVTEPTFTAGGYTTHTCSVCGDSYKDSYTDPKRLDTPKISRLENKADGIKISWDKVAGAEKYKLVLKTETGWKTLRYTVNNSFTWTGAESGVTYTFGICCVTSDGKTATSAFDSTGKTIQYIARPTIGNLKNTAKGVQITWDAVPGAAKYKLVVKTPGSSWKTIWNTVGTSYVWTGAESGVTYTFGICCTTADGKTYTSAFDAAGKTIKYVAQPSISRLENTAKGVHLIWNAVPGAAKYKVVVKTATSGWKTVGYTSGNHITWTGAESGVSYTFGICCVTSDGKTATSSFDATGKTIQFIARPTIAAVQNTAEGIKITWKAVPGAEKYKLMVKTSNTSWKTIRYTVGTSYTWTGAESGKTYTFGICCVSADGKTYTSAFDGTGKTIQFIAQPTIGNLKNTAKGIQITWDAVPGAAKYKLVVKTPGSSWKTIWNTVGTSYVWTGAESGKTYTFGICCVSADGKTYTSAFDGTGKTIQYIARPTIGNLKNTAKGVQITWDAVPGAAKYKLVVKTPGSSWKTIWNTVGTSYVWTGAESGKTYTFGICCVSADGKTYTSAFDAAGKTIKYVAQPSISRLENTAKGVHLIWNAVPGAAKYKVVVKTATSGWKTVGYTSGNHITWTGAESGVSYTFGICCVTSDGKTATSSFDATGKTIRFIARPTIAAVQNTAEGIKITWKAVPGAAKYKLVVKTPGSSWKTIWNTVGTSYTWTGAESGKTYTFGICCTTADGKRYTSAFDSIGKTIKYIAEPGFSSLKSTASGVKLTWKKVPGAVMYKIVVKTATSGWKTVGYTAGNNFTWAGATEGVTYTFGIRCVSVDGKTDMSSFNTTGWTHTFNP